MAITVREIFETAMMITDNYSRNGVLIGEARNKDYELKTPALVNLCLSEVSRNIELFGEIEFEYIKMNNLLTDKVGFDKHYHNDSDLIFEAKGAKMYAFDVDTECTVFIEENLGSVWTTVEQIDIKDINDMTTYRGLINIGDPSHDVRLRFEGDYFFVVTNVALFDKKVPIDRIQDYDKFIRYKLPEDFIEVYQMYIQDEETYRALGDYRIEGQDYLVLPREYQGTVKMIYKKSHKKVTSLDDTLEISREMARPIPYFLIKNLFIDEDPKFTNYFTDMYDQERFRLRQKAGSARSVIQDVYGSWGV